MSKREGGRRSPPWPPIILVGALALGFALQAILPMPWLAGAAAAVLRWIGVLAVIAALVGFASAVAALRRRHTTFRLDRPSTALVTDGPFRYSRNPIYTAMVALIAGAGLAAANLWLVLLAPAAAVGLQKLAIEPEERHLQAQFGDAWSSFADKVRRWL